MNSLQRTWQKIAPDFLLVLVLYVLVPISYMKRRKKSLTHFKNLDHNTLLSEICDGVNHLKMIVCTYHHPDDLNEIDAILQSYGFVSKVSDSYVLYFQEDEEPSFRKVLFRAERS